MTYEYFEFQDGVQSNFVTKQLLTEHILYDLPINAVQDDRHRKPEFNITLN